MRLKRKWGNLTKVGCGLHFPPLKPCTSSDMDQAGDEQSTDWGWWGPHNLLPQQKQRQYSVREADFEHSLAEHSQVVNIANVRGVSLCEMNEAMLDSDDQRLTVSRVPQ